jgi:1-acylglycerone phosphate reductase
MKTVLITGCSEGGIGSSLVLAFQRHGLHVFATSRNVSKMSHLKDLPNVTLLPLEVTDSSQITAAVEAVKAHTGGTLDCFVNNAGRSYFMPTLDIDIGEAKGIFESNFWGALSLIQAFAPLIIAAKGTIVNNCSVSGHVNVPWLGLFIEHFCVI